ncbi:hypothetical protein B0H17DRAFT_1188111 [Mycena rosella]|uniref:DUF6532 domain-containing protein n=1 Tax=Mycena rosella TaxID=1033263 RepID=A0AAD7BM79_MYCRO|nr:hypothetical protein B0H17DRAFT_1188111 [Mycena rosella]
MAPTASKTKPKESTKKAAPSELEKLIAHQKKTQKALEKQLAEANAKLVAKRNNDLLDEEEDAAKASSLPASSSPPASDSFEEEDSAGLAGLLGSDRVTEPEDNEKTSDVGSVVPDISDEEELEGSSDELPTPMQDDEMVTDKPEVRRKMAAGQRKAPTGTSKRVTQSTFSPGSVHLANVGRLAVRVGIATQEGFPSNHADFAWDALSGAVETSQVPELIERLATANKSDKRRSELTADAWGGAPQLRGEIKSICKAAVASFGIPGDFTPAEITKHIKWLTGRKGIFKYGGIDLKNQTYNVQQPYGASFYKAVITKQWFDTNKSEGVRTASCEAYIDSPVPLLVIVTGAMRNSLSEWSTGVRIQIKFTEEEFGPQYQRHRAALLNLQAKSPTWSAQFQRELYVKIVSTSNFPHLKEIIAPLDEDELDGVDFEALEAHATGKDQPDVASTPTDAAGVPPV